MKLSVRALATVCAILWGAAILAVGAINVATGSYGASFLRGVSSIYPGFRAPGTFGDILIGTLYAVVDGAVFGWLFGWMYNAFVASPDLPSTREPGP